MRPSAERRTELAVATTSKWTLSRATAPLLCSLGLAVFAPAAQGQIATAKVAQGRLAGGRQGIVSAFLGIPFAAPPVGQLRWKAPAPAARWQGVRDATKFGPSCRQSVTPNGFGPWTAEYVVTSNVNEDCLYLNVWTPARKATEKLPVVVWIHGGGFSGGSGSVPIYNGERLASKGVIVVTINYRLGLYGFLAHPELSAENPKGASGNYGLQDQIAALRWIKANVAAFGGDPARVTIAGQSAGSASVQYVMASPQAKGLFRQAIAQSGSGMGLFVPSREMAEAAGAKALKGIGLDIAGLRALPPDQLEKAIVKANGVFGVGFSPDADGIVLPSVSAVETYASDVPVLTGLTANEMRGLAPNYGKVTAEAFRADLQRRYGALATQFLARYRADSDSEANVQGDKLGLDRGLAATNVWARNKLAGSTKPVYVYLWTHIEPGPAADRYRSFHSSEIPYIFDTLSASPTRPFGQKDRELATIMSSYWVNFIKTGNPNGPGLLNWPRYSINDRQIVEIGDAVTARPILAPDAIELFDAYLKSGGKLGLF